MNPLDWIGGLIKVIPEQVGGYFRERQAQKSKETIRKMELEDAIHKRKVDLISQGLAADASWEVEQIRNSGYKDEWVLSLISIPLVMCFIPGLDVYVLAGFNVLAKTPDWYTWLILLIFTAIYGIRIWRRQDYDTLSPRQKND